MASYLAVLNTKCEGIILTLWNELIQLDNARFYYTFGFERSFSICFRHLLQADEQTRENCINHGHFLALLLSSSLKTIFTSFTTPLEIFYDFFQQKIAF